MSESLPSGGGQARRPTTTEALSVIGRRTCFLSACRGSPPGDLRLHLFSAVLSAISSTFSAGTLESNLAWSLVCRSRSCRSARRHPRPPNRNRGAGGLNDRQAVPPASVVCPHPLVTFLMTAVPQGSSTRPRGASRYWYPSSHSVGRMAIR